MIDLKTGLGKVMLVIAALVLLGVFYGGFAYGKHYEDQRQTQALDQAIKDAQQAIDELGAYGGYR